MHILELRWKRDVQEAVLKANVQNKVKLKEEVSRISAGITGWLRGLRQSETIPIEFHITADLVEVPRLFGKKRR